MSLESGVLFCMSTLEEGGKNFLQTLGAENIFTSRGGQTFYVGGGSAYDDDDEEMDVTKANNLVSEASKLSAGARIFRGPLGPEILVFS